MASLSWDRWVLYGDGWQTSYTATGTVTVSREVGSDKATVVTSVNMISVGGDNAWWQLHVVINGSEYTSWSSGSWHGEGTSYNMNKTVDIIVGTAAGSLSVQIYMTIYQYESYSGGTSEKKTVTLNYDSKGASSIKSATNLTVKASETLYQTITWDSYSDAFKFKIGWKFGSYSYTSSYVTSPYSATWGIKSQQSLLEQLPNSPSGTMTVTLYTYDSDGKSIGSTTKDVTVTCDSSLSATYSNLKWSGQDSGFGVYIIGCTPKLSFTPTGQYGATAKSAVLTFNNTPYNNNSLTDGSNNDISTAVISTAGVYSSTLKITDSRGYVSTIYSGGIQVYDYHKPSASIDLKCNGPEVTYTAGWDISSVNSKNAKKIYVGYRKVSTGGSYTTAYSNDALSAYSGSYSATLTLSDADTESYEFIATVYDSKNTSGISKTKSTGVVCLSLLKGGNGARFFGEADKTDEGLLTIYGRMGESMGVRILQPKNSGKEVNSYLSCSVNAETCVRGLWDTSEDGIETKALWWCYLADSGNINISNTANASNRGIYLNSNTVCAKIDGVDKQIYDWVNTDSTVNGWRVRKTARGIWDCYKDITVTGTINNAWGSVYYLELGSLTFPQSVSSVDKVLSCTLTRKDTTGWVWTGEAQAATVSRTPIWELYRPVAESTAKTYKFTVHAILDFT